MIPYWEDACPTCGGKCVLACRCFRNERKCKQGHWWRRGPDDEPIVIPGPHLLGDKPAGTVNVTPPQAGTGAP